jgi:predicted RND superfamily exporter protein
LKAFDVVVFAKELPGCDLATVEKSAQRLVDARDFQFNPFAKDDLTSAKRDDRVQVIYTGVVPVVYKAQRTLMNSLVTSTNWAFLAISICMMLLLRRGPLRPWNLLNVRGGMVSMLPNVFPLIMVFGTLGFLGVEIDIGSMMTASIAIGVAVDDTIHYLEWFRNGMKAGLTRHQAIANALQHCGSAMFETMLIGGLGLSVFAFSTFTPTQRFGIMMLTMLAVGLIGDLVWLPALLAGPLGKYFEPTVPRPTPTNETPIYATDAGPLPGNGEAPRMQLDAPHSARTQVRRDAAH